MRAGWRMSGVGGWAGSCGGWGRGRGVWRTPCPGYYTVFTSRRKAVGKTKTRTCHVLYLGLPSSRGGCAMVA